LIHFYKRRIWLGTVAGVLTDPTVTISMAEECPWEEVWAWEEDMAI